MADGRNALLKIDHSMEDYNSEHIPVWATAHHGSTLHQLNQPSVRSNRVNSTYVSTVFQEAAPIVRQKTLLYLECSSIVIMQSSIGLSVEQIQTQLIAPT
jgi:hypothetical protein